MDIVLRSALVKICEWPVCERGTKIGCDNQVFMRMEMT